MSAASGVVKFKVDGSGKTDERVEYWTGSVCLMKVESLAVLGTGA